MSGSSDVRAFYAALGIELPGWSQRNVTVRCFADPGAHAHEDRSPSCSVSLEHGAWRCWACGAEGGAYHAALANGQTPSSAFELLVRHGLTDHHGRTPRARAHRRTAPRATVRPHRAVASTLAATEADVKGWHDALLSEDGQRWRDLLTRQRLWSQSVMRELEVGQDGRRITIPIRDACGALQGVLRYRPAAVSHKMLAVPGTRLGLIPHPACEPSVRVLLVEGPPDMIAARSLRWPAIAVPGDHAWKPEWAQLFRGRSVTVLMDSDPAGRAAAQRIAADLRHIARVHAVDLAPGRDDGYDLTNWLHEQPRQGSQRWTASSSPRPTIKR